MPHRDSLRRRRTPWAAALAIVVVTGAGLIATVAWADARRPAVDGLHFTDAELALAQVRGERAGLASPATDGDAVAIEVLRGDLALFAIARELGVSDVTRPSDISDSLDEVNRDRATTAAADDVLYGPVAYDERSFYGKSLTDIRAAAIERLEASPDHAVSDSEARARFDADPDQWSDAVTTFTLSRATRPGGLAGTAEPAEVLALADGGWPAIVGGAAVDEIALSSDQLAAGALSPDATAALAAASDGSLIGPTTANGEWTYYRLETRAFDEARTFDHYRERIRTVLVEERLDAMVAEARAVQEVRMP